MIFKKQEHISFCACFIYLKSLIFFFLDVGLVGYVIVKETNVFSMWGIGFI